MTLFYKRTSNSYHLFWLNLYKKKLEPEHKPHSATSASIAAILASLAFKSASISCKARGVENDVLALDYKPGDDWNEDRVIGLFQLLYRLQQQTPTIYFSHADEGCRGTPHPEFTKAFALFCSEMNA